MSDSNELEMELTALQAFARDFMAKRAFSQAIAPLQKCVLLSRQIWGDDARFTIDAMEVLGVCLYLCTLHKDAVFQLNQVYAYRTRDGGDSPATVLYTAKHLGLALSELGLHAEARPVLQNAVRLSVNLYGHESATALMVKSRLAKCLCCLHEWQDLSDLCHSVSLDFEMAAGQKYNFKLSILRNLAVAEYNLGQYERALSTVFKALALAKGISGLGNIAALDDLRLASRCLLKLKRYDEAVAMCEKVHEIARHALGEKAGYCSMLLQELASVRFNCARLLRHDQRVAADAARKSEQSVS